MRLFSCRNDRFRSAFEQIWPTLRLTESELNLFKRNSRMFVVDTGKSISLKHKFNLSRPLAISEEGSDRPKKPYYAEAKAALFESDFHLDGAGEHPRYLKIRKIRTQFGIRLQNLRKVRLLLGFARRRYIQKAYEQTRVQPGSSKAWKLISTIESRLGSFALRSGLASDILAARKLLRGKLLVNGNLPMHIGPQAHVVQPGDILMPVDARKSGARIALNLGSGFLSEVRRTAL